MPALLKKRKLEFEGFGPSILSAVARERLDDSPVPKDRMQARAMLHDQCPITPGVYGWLDNNNQICYVGKSKCLRKRLLSYFAKTPADKKTVRIVQHSHRLVWEPVSHELLALIREQELIYRWRPEFNTQGQPVKRQPAFLCISGGVAPNVFFTRRVTPKAQFSIGPISGTGRLRAAVESMNQIFRLRDCPDKTPFSYNEQMQLFDNPSSAKCIRYELNSCPGPCAGLCDRKDYLGNMQQAMDFLLGGVTSKLTLDRLQDEMKAASLSHSFERAAVLRDHFLNLRWLARRLKQLESAQQKLNGVLPITGKNYQKLWLILRGGRLVGSAAAPRDRKRKEQAVEKLEAIEEKDFGLPTNLMEMNMQMIMMSWFRKYPKYKQQLKSFDEAIETCKRPSA
ncbi:GIY-YIG nuclease family protein [Mariniblastus fucicola]|uniref:UvrABC system protein C n=1 Tax=Mariniblastus fucicola TaxID=980251 RepID=A0A5B9PF74_9BACT|nr:GIY-YIG nuclease family protein [Mariniblastus fucicola]QEG23830.1 UvrABC system protein C [Mariniblastus fucicola]